MKGMDWKDLQLVSAIAGSGSASAAARALGLAPSTLSRRVLALEDRLGVVFFDKHKTGYELTEDGAYIVEAIEPMELATAEVRRRVMNCTQHRPMTVTVTATSLLGLRVCAVLPEFFNEHPNIKIALSQSEHIQDLNRAPADVALRATVAPAEHLWGQRIGSVGFVVAASRGYAEQVDGITDPAARWVVFDETLSGTIQYTWERANVPDERRVFETSSRHLHLEALRCGCGLGLVPDVVARDEPALVEVATPRPETRAGLWVLTHERLKNNPAVREVMAFFARRGREMLGG